MPSPFRTISLIVLFDVSVDMLQSPPEIDRHPMPVIMPHGWFGRHDPCFFRSPAIASAAALRRLEPPS